MTNNVMTGVTYEDVQDVTIDNRREDWIGKPAR